MMSEFDLFWEHSFVRILFIFLLIKNTKWQKYGIQVIFVFALKFNQNLSTVPMNSMTFYDHFDCLRHGLIRRIVDGWNAYGAD